MGASHTQPAPATYRVSNRHGPSLRFEALAEQLKVWAVRGRVVALRLECAALRLLLGTLRS